MQNHASVHALARPAPEVTIEHATTQHLFEVVRRPPGQEPVTTVTDAPGVAALAEDAAASGARLHVRPLPSDDSTTD